MMGAEFPDDNSLKQAARNLLGFAAAILPQKHGILKRGQDGICVSCFYGKVQVAKYDMHPKAISQ